MRPSEQDAAAIRDAVLQTLPPAEGMAARGIIVLVAFATHDGKHGAIEPIALANGSHRLLAETIDLAKRFQSQWEMEWTS